ncbi:Flp pilus assembly protein CpaB [Lottiidibacillus patelloidae]|uniref:Flp pilus assembly protein CpaB n=1 Tax=Lottiidibacillus patelloidae TaxID=2670334 RepID=A0A263BTY1_9BACI|nr:Flp pilus assembly protein CpaB [Lottiidibacillus patelloidae]OZM57018.1 Flp pilus assembly protein CpaB [Lottiidibacillus patelloidae]
MQKYQKLLIVFAFLFAVLTTFIGYKLFLSMTLTEEVKQEQLIKVPIAAENLSAITEIDESHIIYVELPEEYVKKFSIITDESLIVGKVLLSPIDKNSPFSKSDLLDEENNIPFILPENYRAITIDLTPVIGVAGYLTEGMYVDIIWTYEVNDVVFTSVPLENVKILAVGSADFGGQIAASESADTITLMLRPEDAQKLTYMTSTGEVKLMLRSSPIIPNEYLPTINLLNVGSNGGGEDNGEN